MGIASALPVLSQAPAPKRIKDTVEAVLSQKKYQPDPDPIYNQPDLNKHVQGPLDWLFRRISDMLDALFEISPVLYYLFIVFLVALLAIIIWHMVNTFRLVMQKRKYRHPASDERSTRRERDASDWEKDAQQEVEHENYIAAVRCLFRALLYQMRASKLPGIRRGMTNRQYLRRFGSTPLGPVLESFVGVIDERWYAGQSCGYEEYQHCLNEYMSAGKKINSLAFREGRQQ